MSVAHLPALSFYPRSATDAAVRTHVGAVRERNEDAVDLAHLPLGSAGQGILVTVADGMGGVSGGATASALTVRVVTELLPELAPCFELRDADWQRRAAGWLRVTATRANESVRQLASDEPSLTGMGSTLLLGLIVDGWLGVAWVGDSRAYLLRDRTLVQLTRDHSWDVDRELEGAANDPEVLSSPYRGMLTSVIGRMESTEIGVRWERLEPGDLLVFATDGLTGYYDGELLASALAEGTASGTDAAQLAERLIAWANAAGGSDNISVGVVRVVEQARRLPVPVVVTQSPVPHRVWQVRDALVPQAPVARGMRRGRRALALGAAVVVTLMIGTGSTALYLAKEHPGAPGGYPMLPTIAENGEIPESQGSISEAVGGPLRSDETNVESAKRSKLGEQAGAVAPRGAREPIGARESASVRASAAASPSTSTRPAAGNAGANAAVGSDQRSAVALSDSASVLRDSLRPADGSARNVAGAKRSDTQPNVAVPTPRVDTSVDAASATGSPVDDERDFVGNVIEFGSTVVGGAAKGVRAALCLLTRCKTASVPVLPDSSRVPVRPDSSHLGSASQRTSRVVTPRSSVPREFLIASTHFFWNPL